MKFATLLLSLMLSPLLAQATPILINLDSPGQYAPGTIVIRAGQRNLYLILNETQAIRYRVAVPKDGKEWLGETHIVGKFAKPAWAAPAEVSKDHPELAGIVIPGGAPNNPMGAAAMTLERSEIAIHGTTEKMRASIGTAASYGCVRMLNEDVSDLFLRVQVGTPVIMLP